MAKKKQRSLLRMQQEKLRKQRALTKSKPSTPASQRVEKVKVKVEPPRQLKGSKPPKALPQGQKGGAIKPKVKPTGRVSAKRAQAAARLARAAQGTKSPGVRTGQPAGSANRMYGANRVNAAVRRATRAGRGTRVKGGLLGAAMTGLTIAGATGGLGKKVKDSMANDEARMERLLKNPLKKDTTEKRKSKPTKKTSGQKTNRRGRVVSKPKVAPAKRGMSNIPPKEGTGKGSPNDKTTRDLRSGRSPDKATPKASPKPSVRASKPSTKAPASKPPVKSSPKPTRPFGGDAAPKPSQIKTPKSSPKPTPKKKEKKMSKNRMYLLRRQGRL